MSGAASIADTLNQIGNLVTACRSCNGLKGPRMLEEFRQLISERSGAAAVVFYGETALGVDLAPDLAPDPPRDPDEGKLWIDTRPRCSACSRPAPHQTPAARPQPPRQRASPTRSPSRSSGARYWSMELPVTPPVGIPVVLAEEATPVVLIASAGAFEHRPSRRL
jgi:hypothetical protein